MKRQTINHCLAQHFRSTRPLGFCCSTLLIAIHLIFASGMVAKGAPPEFIVSITSPASGSTYLAPGSANIVVTAYYNKNPIAMVELYDGDQLVATQTYVNGMSTVSMTYSWAFTAADVGTHTWTAKAYDDGRKPKTASSAPVNLTITGDSTPPTVPTGVTATAFSSNQIGVTWNASTDTGGSGLGGYKVYRNGTFIAIALGTSYTNNGLNPDTQYCYTVAAYDNAGNTSAQSSPSACATTLGGTPVVTVSATDPNAAEPGTDKGTFTISRTGSTSSGLTVYFSTGGTAASGSDYTSLGTSTIIPAGSSSATLTVNPIDDTTVENSETVIVTLSANAAYSIGSPGSATVTIADDDVALPTVSITATDSNASEPGTDKGMFTISRTGSTSSGLLVYFSTSGTATSGSDYSSLGTSAIIPAGSSSTTLTVNPIDDTTVESSETVIVTLSANAAYGIGSPSSGTVTIADNDSSLPTVSITATDPNASEPGTDKGTFTISRTGSTSAALVVNFSTSGTATSGSDYTSLGFATIIPAGSSSTTLTVSPIDDATVESSETVIVTLSVTAGYDIGSPSSATVTIADNDSSLPTVSITATDPNASEPGTDKGMFTISRTGSTTSPLTVYFSASGSATSGSDFTSLGTSTVIPVGLSSVTMNVNPLDDTLVEGSETVIVTLTANPAYQISGSAAGATVTIADNDALPNAPSNLTATAVATDQINLGWSDNSSDETGFKIERSIASLGQWVQIFVTAANVTAYADASLTAETTVYYRISAYNPAGSSPYSNIADATTFSDPGTTNDAPRLVGFIPAVGDALDVVVANNKAYVASHPFGLSIVDASTASSTNILGASDSPFYGRALAVSGTRAVALAKTPAGLINVQVLDVSNPARPLIVGTLATGIPLTTDGNGYRGVALNSTATRAVVTLGTAGIWVIDLTNPANPTKLGGYDTPGTAFAVVLNNTATTAYVADGLSDLQIINITNPAQPTLLGSLSLPGTQLDIDVNGTTVYLACQNGTLYTVDVTNPAAPTFKGSVLLSGPGYHVDVDGNRAAVLSGNATSNFLDVVDITNPASPAVTSSVVVGPPGTVQGIDLANNRAYVAADGDGLKVYDLGVANPPNDVSDTFEARSLAKAGMRAVVLGKDIASGDILVRVLDVSDPTRPTVLGELPTTIPLTTDGNGYRGIALNSTATRAVVTLGTAGIWIIDLTNPANPTKLGGYDTPGTAFAVVLNNTATTAYVADGLSDLQIINITNPAKPTLLGSLSLPGTQLDIDVNGTTVYLACQNGTLYTVDVTNPAAPTFKGSVLLSGAGYHLDVDGNRAAVLSGNASDNYLDVVNVTNPASPALTSSVVVGPPGTVQGLDLVSNRAYVAADGDGLKIYDVSGSGTPVLLGSGYSVGNANDVVVADGQAYVADYPATISVISLAP